MPIRVQFGKSLSSSLVSWDFNPGVVCTRIIGTERDVSCQREIASVGLGIPLGQRARQIGRCILTPVGSHERPRQANDYGSGRFDLFCNHPKPVTSYPLVRCGHSGLRSKDRVSVIGHSRMGKHTIEGMPNLESRNKALSEDWPFRDSPIAELT